MFNLTNRLRKVRERLEARRIAIGKPTPEQAEWSRLCICCMGLADDLAGGVGPAEMYWGEDTPIDGDYRRLIQEEDRGLRGATGCGLAEFYGKNAREEDRTPERMSRLHAALAAFGVGEEASPCPV